MRIAGVAAYAALLVGAVVVGSVLPLLLPWAAARGTGDEGEAFEPLPGPGVDVAAGGFSGQFGEEAPDGADTGRRGRGRGAGARRRAADAKPAKDEMEEGARRACVGASVLNRSSLANASAAAAFGSDRMVPRGMEAAASGTSEPAGSAAADTMAGLMARRNMDQLFLASRLRRQRSERSARRSLHADADADAAATHS